MIMAAQGSLMALERKKILPHAVWFKDTVITASRLCPHIIVQKTEGKTRVSFSHNYHENGFSLDFFWSR